jgi:hypothetical protein
MSHDATLSSAGQVAPSAPSPGPDAHPGATPDPGGKAAPATSQAPERPAAPAANVPEAGAGRTAPGQQALPQPGAPSGQAAPAKQGKPEHRKSPRRRVLKEGKVIFGRSQSVMDVTIDNMSEGGAHIRMLSSHGVPQEFYLAEASRGIIHRAEVAWRTATGMGLRLLGPLEDAAAREAFLRKFRRG